MGASNAFCELAEQMLDDLCARRTIGSRPAIEWRRLRTTAGRAYYKERRIVLSEVLITDHERLRSTLAHEYAHLLAYAEHGDRGKGHGRVWRAAMTALGEIPSVHHAYECARNTRRQEVVYSCSKCNAQFVRARRIPRGKRYVHIRCGGAIRFVRATSLPKPTEL